MHTALDLIGMIPALGNIADGLNAAIYLAEGDLANAAMSAVALLPLGGAVAVAGKFASKYGDNILRFVGKNIDTVAKAARKATDAVVGAGKKIVNGVSDILGKVFKHGDEVTDTATILCKNGQCFVAGTLILTNDGYKKIEDVKVGDKVIATDPETGETTEKEVVETYIRESNELIHVWVNGEEIVTTPTHPFYVPEIGWTDAADLRAGDMLVLVNGEYVIIEKIQHEFLEEPITVYNFEVEDFHTYYVGEQSMLVHNANCKKYTTAYYEGTTMVGDTQRDISRRVYQRNDIDWDRVDPDTGLTNRELARGGYAPFSNDGSRIELHHLIQKEPGSMVEIPASLHDRFNRQLHGLVENGRSFRNNPVLEKQYNNFRSRYWRWRAKNLG